MNVRRQLGTENRPRSPWRACSSAGSECYTPITQERRRYKSCRAYQHRTKDVNCVFQHLTTREPESCFASTDSVRSGADDGRVLVSASGTQIHLQAA